MILVLGLVARESRGGGDRRPATFRGLLYRCRTGVEKFAVAGGGVAVDAEVVRQGHKMPPLNRAAGRRVMSVACAVR